MKVVIAKSFVLIVLMCSFVPFLVHAQASKPSEPKTFQTKARAADASRMKSGKTTIVLWGVRLADTMSVSMAEEGRAALDDLIGSGVVKCELRARKEDYLLAQCVNKEDQDLGLGMIQAGYVTVDRRYVYESIYEKPYLEAEQKARSNNVGVWAFGSGSSKGFDGTGVMIIVGCLVFVILSVFGVLTFIIMSGFQKVIDAQNRNIDMIDRERKLKDKERSVVANMLDTEIKANKSKIEAYLVVYEEMLADMKNPQRQPKYKKSGDIMQKQPALDRAVFDRNTDKLDMLGDELSSEVIHFYARIKTKPDYVNLTPEMSVDDAVLLVEEGLDGARRMDRIAERLVSTFFDEGLSGREL